MTNPEVLDALYRWLRDNPPDCTPAARATIYQRLRELNSLVATQERAAGRGPAGKSGAK